MSAPSSPASSRRGSPALMLTPRSKIKALLATVDSSDEESGAPTPLKKPVRTTVRPVLAQLDDDDDDESESDVEIRPRGRLAARMQANSTSHNEKGPQNARERVRQMLQSEEKHQQSREEQDDVDDDLPVAPRRLQRRQAREATPEKDTTRPNQGKPCSPGLFVSSPAGPSPSRSVQHNGLNSDSSDSDDLPALKSDRFKALIEKKRQERLAREAKEEAERAERRARQEKLSSELDSLDSNADDVSNIDDDEGGQTLTQKSVRAPRKASKKAIEEINRETQRMARSMQLAHQPKTRKTFTKSSLFQRFNFRPDDQPAETVVQPASSSRPTTPQSDVEVANTETPLSSPTSAQKIADAFTVIQAVSDDDEDMPALDELARSAHAQPIDKGKDKAVEVPEEQPAEVKKPKKQSRIRLPNLIKTFSADSDDELEVIVTVQDKVKAVFDHVPIKTAQESRSLQVHRALALEQAPDTDMRITSGQFQAALKQKVRQQAKLERTRRLELLKSQGIVVQTVGEREKQMEEVEDIVAKARREVQRVTEHEREAAKKKGTKTVVNDPLAWDDSDDEYKASENEAEVEVIELSGSEDDQVNEPDDESDAASTTFDVEAEETDGKEETRAGDDDAEETVMQTRRRRARIVTVVLSDDEGEIEIKATPEPARPARPTNQISPAATKNASPAAPGSVLRSAKKTFIPGLPVKGPAGLGLTQIFAGTMDDSQMGTANGPTQSMMPDFDQFPDSNFSATMNQPEDSIIQDSQRSETQGTAQNTYLDLFRSQMHGLDSQMQEYPGEAFEVSQDGGFQIRTPIKERFVELPFSTDATEIPGTMEDGPRASPLVRRGKLRRRADIERASEPTQPISTEVSITAQDAFAKLKEQTKHKEKRHLTDAFHVKTSKAKELFEQEAMESDDEYAGLGGVDGEDSDNESNASVQEMIDDAAASNADDSKLAAFYADRARAEDEQQVEKLFKDITTGMLRRKRGAGYDLSDSDDDGEARQRMKRRQSAKMRKALFTDERVKKLAETPGNQAFLRTIEDRDSDDEMNILEVVESSWQRDSSQTPATESQNAAQQTIPESQSLQPARQALVTASNGGDYHRPPAHMRRTKNPKKSSSIGEVRETLSNLLEEPDASLIPATEAGSESEDEDVTQHTGDKENHSPRRTITGVIDRIKLKRGNSNVSTRSGRLAFASAASGVAFKVPPLLHRARTNSSMTSTAASITSNSSAGTAAGGFGDEAKVKRTAGKRSGVVSRAVPVNEGHARIQECERRREEKKMQVAEKRFGVLVELFSRGSFA
ncbi:DNA replication checkpoint mediator [Beauveria brongniartii RCEF 3172]|uniref:DNA replication checkpoint mediator n=1 Tax=Beauveria brongniartii RCEF 3172 TaxID=1081107 RepID=A0A166ZI25_9HYPO|nr:DNA replication checkpoint mediator [Beauveria brongniartii RCEF 3172]